MRVFKQFPVYVIGRILPAAIGFFGIAIYTRFLDPASFGTYALLLSTSFLFSMTGFAWLKVAMLRNITSIDQADEPDFFATVAVTFGALSVLAAAAMILFLRIYNPALSLWSLTLTAVTAIASAWFELNVAIAQGRMRLVTYGLLQTARAIGILGFSLLFLWAGYKSNALLAGFTLGNCAGFIVLGLWSPALRGTFRLGILKRLLNFGWPASAASLTYFSVTFQRFVLTAAGGAAAVGVFAAATDFAQQTVGLLIGTATLAGQPLAFRARDLGTKDELSEQLRNNARLVFAVGLGSAAGLMALAGPIAHLYFGAKFRLDAGPLLILSAAAMFLSGFRANYFEQGFEIARRTRPVAVIAAFRVVSTVVLSAVLIFRWGAIGAAWATVATEVLGLLLSAIWVRRLMHIPVPVQSFVKIVAATAAMIGVIEFIPSRYSPAGLTCAVLAGLFAFAGSFTLLYLRQMRALLGMTRPAGGAG
jgi:O-antigen/teichoic acid export membrane protein